VRATEPFVPFGLTVCGIEELPGHCRAGASHVLSILDPGYPLPAAFAEFSAHARLELRFNDVIDPSASHIVPSENDVARLLAFADDVVRKPPRAAHLLVHCHMGISRSTAAMAMILAMARPDRPAHEALAEVLRIRPHAWPNLRMIEFGDALLQRKGELIDAVRAHYRAVLARKPHLVAEMVALGRGREVVHE
jgi:predicted protein tyrosine phosphatase